MLRPLAQHRQWLKAFRIFRPSRIIASNRQFNSELYRFQPVETLIKRSLNSTTGDTLVADDVKSDESDFRKICNVDFSVIKDKHKQCFCLLRGGWRLRVDFPPTWPSDRNQVKNRLRGILGDFGEIVSIWIRLDPEDKNTAIGGAFVYMKDYEGACKAFDHFSATEEDSMKIYLAGDEKRNLVIYGLSEEETEDLPQKVESLLVTMGVQTSLSGTAHRTDEEDSEGKARPVLVSLDKRVDVDKVLERSYTLQESSMIRFKRAISISRQKLNASKLYRARLEHPEQRHEIINNVLVSFPKTDEM